MRIGGRLSCITPRYNLPMRDEVVQRINEINREFYRGFAEAFAATRTMLQPGVRQALALIASDAAVLDLGCGTGDLAAALHRAGHRGPYTGLDASPGMLTIARLRHPGMAQRYFEADLTSDGWQDGLEAPFDCITAFAVLHHIPSVAHRTSLARSVAQLLHQDGQVILSVWNFLSGPRWAKRHIPWEQVGLQESDVEPGDVLLDWRDGGVGVRYVHAFELDELSALAAAAGLRVVGRYESDGRGGRLGHYEVWRHLRF